MNMNEIMEALSKANEFDTLDREGKLVRLPYKVGDKVFIE